MASALADIWDEPVAQNIVHSPPHTPTHNVHADENDGDGDVARPAKRPRSTLFLESDSEDDAREQPPQKASRTTSERPDIDALFDDLDEEPEHAFQDLAPALDLDALRRQADAENAKSLPLTPHEILPSSSPTKDDGDGVQRGKKGKDGQKERKRIPRLDEARLMGPDGFPALVKQVKNFRPKGKGHEASDLNRLLQVYQFWAHKMYPRSQFRETTQRVEKLCHSNRMHYALRTWRDESKGIFHDRQAEETVDITSDAEKSSEDESDQLSAAAKQAKQDTAVSSDATKRGEQEQLSSREPSAPPPPRKPTYEFEDDDFDMDAIIREDEERRAAAAPTAASASQAPNLPHSAASTPAPAVTDITDEEEARWDDPAPLLQSNPPQAQPEDDDEMWDIVREMEEAEAAKVRQAAGTSPQTAAASATGRLSTQGIRPATNEEGWDEMYA